MSRGNELSAADRAALAALAAGNIATNQAPREIARLYGVTLDEPKPQPDTARLRPDHPPQKPGRRVTNVTSDADGGITVDVEDIGQPSEKRRRRFHREATMMPDGHTSDESDAHIAQGEVDFNLLAARVGALYIKQGLSPPFTLRDAVKHWLGLTQDEIVTIVQQHFADHRRRYTCGSGDGHFHIVQAAIRKAIEAKHPSGDHADEEPDRPRRRCADGSEGPQR